MRSWITKTLVIPSAAEAIALSANAAQLARQAVDDLGRIPQYVRTGEDGLTITDGGEKSVMRINSSSVSIGTTDSGTADGFSQFAASYVQFGQYQMRRTADSGIAFRWVGE